MIEASYKIIKYNSILLIIGEKFEDTLPHELLWNNFDKEDILLLLLLREEKDY